MLKRKSFCIVCIANYCRSPVLENLLKAKYQDKYEFFSAGLSPISKPTMDPRSLKYLIDKNIIPEIHNPKRINLKMLEYFDYFLAIDIFVLYQLNNTHPNFKKKFKLVTSNFDNVDIIDPYNFNDAKYKDIMDLILFTSQNLDLEIY